MHRGSAFLLLLILAFAAPAAAGDLSVRLDGKVLRKASGKLVLSLSDVELRGRKNVSFQRRGTGEIKVLPLASVYRDISYTDVLPPDAYEAFREEEWIPFVVWTIPRETEALNRTLHEIQVQQNDFRRELGKALTSDEETGVKVSSRLTLNKIEKFNRIAAQISRAILEIAKGHGDFNPFLYPIDVQIGFNPFTGAPSGALRSPLDQVREVMFWEVHRVYTQQFGIDENLVDFLYDSPSTVRRIVPFTEEDERDVGSFVPTVTLSAESVDAAIYMMRQKSDVEVRQLVRIKYFRDPFIVERPILDRIINVGQVVGVRGKRIAVTFIPPFMKPGETVRVFLDPDGSETIPIVLESPRAAEGYTISAELPEEQAAKVRSGMPVYRR